MAMKTIVTIIYQLMDINTKSSHVFYLASGIAINWTRVTDEVYKSGSAVSYSVHYFMFLFSGRLLDLMTSLCLKNSDTICLH